MGQYANKFLTRYMAHMSNGDPKTTVASRNYFYSQIKFNDTDGLRVAGMDKDFLDIFDILITKIKSPNFAMTATAIDFQTPLGAYTIPGNGTFVPEDRSFSMEFLDTDAPIFEGFFVPWAKYVGLPLRTPNGNAYLTADITILTYQNDATTLSYVTTIRGAFPVLVDTPDYSYSPNTSNFTRSVGFKCSDMKIEPASTKLESEWGHVTPNAVLWSDNEPGRQQIIEIQRQLKLNTDIESGSGIANA